jgi:hypothetical protein
MTALRWVWRLLLEAAAVYAASCYGMPYTVYQPWIDHTEEEEEP